MTLHVVRSGIGWTWEIRDGASLVDGGNGRTREECQREGESFLRWHRARIDARRLVRREVFGG